GPARGSLARLVEVHEPLAGPPPGPALLVGAAAAETGHAAHPKELHWWTSSPARATLGSWTPSGATSPNARRRWRWSGSSPRPTRTPRPSWAWRPDGSATA